MDNNSGGKKPAFAFGSPPPPPTYTEAIKRDLIRKSSSGSTSGDHQAGPAWLYHFPQQSQFNSPFTSLQYDDIDHFRTIPVTPATLKLNLGQDPVQLTCPYCHLVIVTAVEREAGCLAYTVSAVLCVIGCWPCAFLPCCISDLLDATHTCPNCKRFLDRFKRRVLD